jgi:RimJ/RimL family protein N-acetyltransferase
MRIETERLILYPISNQEMESLIENENDAELKQAYSEMLQGCINEPENRIWYAVWLMELKNHSDTIVGDFCFKGLCADGMVEIGYGLREGFCGKGYMTEALKAITAWALAQSGVTRVEAETDPENKASQKVLAVCGFIPTGTTGEEGPRFVYKAN